MLVTAGQYIVDAPNFDKASWRQIKVKVREHWIPLKQLSPTDGKELREKDKQLNGEPNYTRGIPSYWWPVYPDKIEFWPAVSNDMQMEVEQGHDR